MAFQMFGQNVIGSIGISQAGKAKSLREDGDRNDPAIYSLTIVAGVANVGRIWAVEDAEAVAGSDSGFAAGNKLETQSKVYVSLSQLFILGDQPGDTVDFYGSIS